MDNPNYPRNRHSEYYLGVNKISKNITKKPSPQSNFDNNNNNNNHVTTRPVSQPQVYNINENDFRNIVQQLTGSPSHHSQEPLPVPVPVLVPRPPPKSPSMRLQRIRPPPLSPILNRPHMPVQTLNNNNNNNNDNDNDSDNNPQPAVLQPPLTGWSTPAESPISAYMRYLQHSINEPGTNSAGLVPNPHGLPTRTNGPPPLLPSPSSQFLLSSPSGYLNLSSPRSPYPLLSPGYQHPSPLTPNFPFSPGILGPGPQPPRVPGVGFPLSPGFFPVLSPRWRD